MKRPRPTRRGGPAAAWHVTRPQAAAYADGSLPETDAWSVEKHVEACASCAARVSAAVRAGTAAPALADIRAALLAFATADAPAEATAPAEAGAPEPAPDAPAARATAQPIAARASADPAPGAGNTPARPAAAAGAPGLAPGVSRPAPTPDTAPVKTAAARHAGRTAPLAAEARAPESASDAPAARASARPIAARASADPAPGAGSAPTRPAAGAGAAPGPTPSPTTHADAPAAREASDAGGAAGRWWGGGRGARAWMVWAAGPAVRGPWLVALLVTGLVAAGAARAAGMSGVRPLLLALAPVLPSAGVAVSYGRHADPMHELAASTPSGGLRLLLTRTASVLAVSVPLLTLAGQLLPAAAGAPATPAWLLPGLALTLAALALASYVGCRIATCAVTGGWLLAVGGPALLAGPGESGQPSLADALSDSLATVLSGPAAQSCWAAAAAVCAGLLAVRRTSFDHLERM
ncbi:zf-HC2 domain-containing protein [Streptomyces sparsogenes]|uniref:zf-HC2 domain-containing protein n=1 Tax=Streptomyces sparsogenes TaxID=67365 RepID=UPI0033C1636A